MPPFPYAHDSRLSELLAQRSTEGLSGAEDKELDSLFEQEGIEDDLSLDVAAAACHLAFLAHELGDEPLEMPEAARRRLEISGRVWVAARASQPAIRPSSADMTVHPPALPLKMTDQASAPTKSSGMWPWLVAAGFALIAAVGWFRTSVPVNPGMDIVSAIAQAPDSAEWSWNDWDNPEVTGVAGSVVWSEALQCGYMKFRGLPSNNPASEQYQLWIVDKRGLSQRVSGAIFDVNRDGEVIVPVKPLIPVQDAALFAITIEQPGGTWVSDMSRRVVVAKRPS
ncbi:MAG: anti-sigma factor [Phycisphaeraceae bacterium]|nr:anti-sigma factor [Phycisphaeraceae bacterium]